MILLRRLLGCRSPLLGRFAGEQTEMLEDEVAGSRMSLNDQSTRRFRGPKKVRFPAKQGASAAAPVETQPLNGAASDGPLTSLTSAEPNGAAIELPLTSPPSTDVGQLPVMGSTVV